jgi:hypothetical protein
VPAGGAQAVARVNHHRAVERREALRQLRAAAHEKDGAAGGVQRRPLQPHGAPQRVRVHAAARAHTAIKKLRIVRLGFGTS